MLGHKEPSSRLLVDFNATAVDYPADTCLHTLVERQAALRPEAIAVEFSGQRLTYAQLDTRANQLAHLLRRHGVGPDVPVALCFERSLELIVSLLAILKAGGAYVPLDASYPEQRLAFMLEDSQPRVLLTTHALAQRLTVASHLPRVFVEEVDFASLPMSPPASGVSARNLAYVVFTSGSTGRPKGVAVEHRSLMRLLHSPRYAHLGPEETFLLIAPISFDASVLEVWGALAWGARLVVFPPDSPGDLELLTRVLTDSGVTTLHLTAGLFSRVVDWKQESLRGLRQLLTGGDVVSAPHVRKALETLRIPVTACYGPTEATLFTSCFRMTEPHEVGTVVPIGRPLSNTEVYVLDARGQPVPVGEPGELYVGGPGLARGYLAQPALTAERFLPHPFSSTPGERLYRTGDLARWREDGVLEFLGRADTQVKVRGFRIELAEVEAALLAHPAVREAVAVVREDVPGDKRLVGYVVARAEPPLDLGELRGFLQQRLPEYMRPSALVALPALPLTANAKVDRKALPPPPLSRPTLETPYVLPSGPHQELLARLWSQVLGVEGLGAADDFFELGGSSLAAIQLLAHVRQTFGVEVPMRRFFEAPTVADQAAFLAETLAGGSTALPPVEPTDRSGPLPLSFSQERVWFIRQLSPENSAYNTSFHVHFEGRLDVAMLERAFTEIVRRHESLRSTFEAREDGRPAQVVQPPYPVHIPVFSLEHVPAEQCEQEIARHRSALMHHVFDFSQLPLFRYELLRFGPEDHLMLGVEQHLIHDGRSLAVLMHELKALYAAYVEGRPSPLPEPTLQLGDLTSWQRSTLRGERLEALTRYWKQTLADAPVALELPLDRPRPSFHRFQGRELRLRIPESLWSRLRTFSRKEGSTLYMTMLSAFYALLHRYTGAEDVVLGSALACRERPEMEGLIGMLVNSVALRTDLSGQPTFRELMRRVREVAFGAFEHQGLPFDRAVEAVNPKRVPGLHPLFQVDFSFHDSPMPLFELPGVRGRLGYARFESSKFDLMLTIVPLQEQTGPTYDSAIESGFMNWEFNTDIFDLATIERLSQHYFTLLESALAHPELRLRELSLLSEQERHQVLREWNATSRPVPEATVVDLFEAQVARAPESLALTCEGQALSYRELDVRANRLAHRLRALGVGPESRVALCLERSVDLVVGLLGILKSGAACVPMDSVWPTERLRLLIEDSGARLAVARPALLERLGQGTLQVLEPDASGEPAQAPARRLHGESLACVLYTSGSTGRPKGVMLTHGSLTHHHLWHARYCDLHEGDRVLQFHSISFDAALEELFPTWMSGATVVMRPAELFPSAVELFSWVGRERLTVLDIPTAYWHQLVQEMETTGARPPDSVRLLLIAGQRAQPEALAAWRRLGGERSRWANLYGPTETTLISTAYDLPALAALPEGRSELPIGYPIDNTQAYVLDARLEPVPLGAPGELYIGGLGVARGYLERPELTAERFVPDAFSQVPGARLYRTGDRVRRRTDGSLEFLGRLDRQIKLRGFRIELGEVEAALCRHPEVREALAVVRPVRSGEQELVAYVVAAGRAPTVAELRRHLQGGLPAYMVPARLVVVEGFPLTPNGKVNVAALPAPEEGESGREQSGSPPNTPTEQALAAIWQEVLGLSAVSRHDNFFDLGGHSLLALRVVSRLRKALQVEVPLSQVFERPTLAELALVVEQGQRQQQPARPALVPRARRT